MRQLRQVVAVGETLQKCCRVLSYVSEVEYGVGTSVPIRTRINRTKKMDKQRINGLRSSSLPPEGIPEMNDE